MNNSGEKHIRVIAGFLRGRKLWGPKNRDIRPLTGIAKEYIFNVLQNFIHESTVLDLFAGTGSIGIEALSRGARSVTFVDNGPGVSELIVRNIRDLGLDKKATIISNDAIQFLTQQKQKNRSFDLIFADPPFRYEYMDKLTNTIGKSDLLKKTGFFIIHYSKDFYERLIVTGLNEIKYKIFGANRISIFQRGVHCETSNLSGNV